MAEEQLRIDALQYHEFPTPGKIPIATTTALASRGSPMYRRSIE